MKCEICGEDIGNDVVLLSIKRADGRLNTIACLRCAENSSAYCKKHGRSHLGFEDDDTTVCILCIEEIIDEKRSEELVIFDRLEENLSREELGRLVKWANISASVTGDPETICVLRAIVTKALRMRKTIEEVINQIIETKSIELILPKWF